MSQKLTYEELEKRIKELEQVEAEYKNREIKCKKIEESLKESEKQYRLIADNAGDVIFALDMELNYTYVSPSIYNLRGFRPEELINHNIKETLKPESLERVSALLSEKLKIKDKSIYDPVVIELEMVCKNGGTIWTDVKASFFCDEDGKIAGILGVTRDITARKEAEKRQQELEAINLRLQKSESLSVMAGGIAHLFNNYLYAVTGNLELALDLLPDNPLIRNHITEAMNAAHRCADISGTMLTYLGQKIVKPELIDISKFCKENYPLVSSLVNDNVTIKTDCCNEKELIVKSNMNQMQQVVKQLIVNANESIGENRGFIKFRARTITASEIEQFELLPVGSKPFADIYACLEVSDSGSGIPQEDIYKIFDPFFTTKFTGRGLGLASVLGIVKSWGGMVGVKSKINCGSSFMIFLPMQNADNLHDQSKKNVEIQQIKPCSQILLVEDHKMVRKMTIAMLNRIGFEVLAASDGLEALELFKEYKDKIGCLITDLSMPKLDGWATLSAIRKIAPNLPAILASGYDEAFAMSRNISEKPQAFLHKPYNIENLRAALSQAVKGYSTT